MSAVVRQARLLDDATLLDPGVDQIESAAVGAGDRLLATLLYALAVHVVIFLGFQFELTLSAERSHQPSLDITLVPRESLQEPDEADFLAQANQQGGGEEQERAKPTTVLQDQQRIAAMQPQVSPVANPVESAPSASQQQAVLAVKRPAEQRVQSSQQRDVDKRPTDLSAATLLQQSRQFARLQAQLAEQQAAYAKRPRKKVISAATREYAYAAYMEAWRAKVERVGTLNYPAAARDAGITGSLRMAVEIRANGSLGKVEISRSSGFPLLDKSALRIVKMAAPFAPLPTSITKEADLLVIVRTWQFTQDSALTSR